MKLTVCDDVVTVTAPAKLNLFLEVTGRRDDGYHDLDTVMQTVELHDTLALTPADRLQLVSPDTPEVPVEDNLVMKAARRLHEALNVGQGACIRLTKRVPSGAGLGGGSSDAASTLAGLCRLWGLTPPDGLLYSLACELGSDVPFFLTGGAARCRGRGEKIFPVSVTGRWYYVIVKPERSNGTAEIYRALTGVGTYRIRSVNGVVGALEQGRADLLQAETFNRLQEPARRCNEQLSRCLETLGAWVGCMTGSGSACFTVCKDEQEAEAVRSRVSTLLPDCTTLTTSDER